MLETMTMEARIQYVLAVANQLSFVSTFLGGIIATMLIAVIAINSEKRSAGLFVATSSFAACCLILSVVCAWRLNLVFHPSFPVEFRPEGLKINLLWGGMVLGYVAGVSAIIASIGVSGWIRSKRSGWVTTVIAGLAMVFYISSSYFL